MDGFANVNGTRLYYETAGSGTPLILIHGFTLDARMWDDQFTRFAAHQHVIRYDLRGFGRSAPVGDMPYTHADDLAALLDHLNISRVAICGLSLGGEIAIDFTLASPDRVLALIAVDAVVGGHRWSEEWRARSGHVWKTARTEGVIAAKAVWLDMPIFTPAREQPAVATQLNQMVADYSGWHWTNRDPHRRSDPPAIERLRTIGAPTLVIVGERDTPDFRMIADHIAREVPGARKIVLSSVGHMANMEAPDQFNADVQDFLADR